MKKGINIGAVPAKYNLDESLKMIADAGFDGVELNMEKNKRNDDSLSLHSQCTNKEIDAIKEIADKYNLKITSIVTSMLWEFPLTSNDNSVRKSGCDVVRTMIDYASEFGSDTILVVPGRVSEDTHYDDAYNNALNALCELKPYAEQKKVAIGIENVWNKFLLSPLEMRDFIDKIGSEYIGSYFDIGNVLINSFPEQWIKILGKRIKKFHAKDFKQSVGNINGFVNLLEGDVNWYNVITEIKKTGYNDFITAELGGYNHFPMHLLNETSKALDNIFLT